MSEIRACEEKGEKSKGVEVRTRMKLKESEKDRLQKLLKNNAIYNRRGVKLKESAHKAEGESARTKIKKRLEKVKSSSRTKEKGEKSWWEELEEPASAVVAESSRGLYYEEKRVKSEVHMHPMRRRKYEGSTIRMVEGKEQARKEGKSEAAAEAAEESSFRMSIIQSILEQEQADRREDEESENSWRKVREEFWKKQWILDIEKLPPLRKDGTDTTIFIDSAVPPSRELVLKRKRRQEQRRLEGKEEVKVVDSTERKMRAFRKWMRMRRKFFRAFDPEALEKRRDLQYEHMNEWIVDCSGTDSSGSDSDVPYRVKDSFSRRLICC